MGNHWRAMSREMIRSDLGDVLEEGLTGLADRLGVAGERERERHTAPRSWVRASRITASPRTGLGAPGEGQAQSVERSEVCLGTCEAWEEYENSERRKSDT